MSVHPQTKICMLESNLQRTMKMMLRNRKIRRSVSKLYSYRNCYIKKKEKNVSMYIVYVFIINYICMILININDIICVYILIVLYPV